MFSKLIKDLDRAAQGTAAPVKQRKSRKQRTSGRKKFDDWTRRRMGTAALPAAYATHVRSRFSSSVRGDEVRIVGCDLVYNIPTTVVSGDYTLFCVIPSNPAYWDGTRIAQLAPAYMNYRPIRLSFHYIPQVAVTQPGTVFMGTLWNGAPAGDNIQQTLVTSNGGCLTQCYIPADTEIKLGGNLQQNLFTMNGSLDPDTSPFVFVAGMAGGSVVPGYFYVEYEYALKNPIGQSWIYSVDSPVAASTISSTTGVNQSVLLLQSTADFGCGTIIDSESSGLFYKGSPVTLAGDTQVAVFSNRQGGSAVMRAAVSSNYVFDLRDWTPSGEARSYLALYHTTDRSLFVYDSAQNSTIGPDYYTTDARIVIPPSTLSEANSSYASLVVDPKVDILLP